MGVHAQVTDKLRTCARYVITDAYNIYTLCDVIETGLHTIATLLSALYACAKC